MNRRTFSKTVATTLAGTALPRAWGAPSTRMLVYIGTRAAGPGEGISACFFDSATGRCDALTLATEIASPTAFQTSADFRFLYSVSETGNDGKSDGGLAAFRIDRKSGTLTPLNRVPSGGGGPTSLALDRTGRTLAVGCFGAGRTNTFPVLADGSLGEQVSSVADSGSGPSPRQKSPHVHCAVFSPGNRFVLSADLGADRIFISRFEPTHSTLTAAEPAFVQCPPGSGPRQIVFHPNGRFAFLLSELVATLTVYAWDEQKGTLSLLQTISCVEATATERSGAGLVMHPSGRFLYTTTRSDNAVEVFAIDKTAGTLTQVQRVAEQGKVPWSCALSPSASHLLTTNFASNSLSLYRIETTSGKLTLQVAVPDVPSPAAAIVIPA